MQFDNLSGRFCSSRFTLAICTLLLGLFGVLSLVAVRGKSPTFDEPIHALSASVALDTGDFRIDYDNPPLWKYWAALPSMTSPVKIDTTDPRWINIPNHLLDEWTLMIDTLYHREGAAATTDKLIGSARVMMLLIGIVLGAVISWWSWRLGGGVAAVTACTLFALDPNFIGHSALIKNDVVIALMFVAMAYAVHLLGQRITAARVLTVGVLCGFGCSIKVSGVLLPPVACLLILLRALQGSWTFRRRPLNSLGSRLLAAVTIQLTIGLLTVLTIWASYGFRFSVARDASVQINTAKLVDVVRAFQTYGTTPHKPWKEPTTVSMALIGLKYKLLPEAWLNGLLYIYSSTQLRPVYYLGKRQVISSWGYYPLAIAVKTPLATLAAGMIAAIAAVLLRVKQTGTQLAESYSRWDLYCLLIPPLVYGLFVAISPSAGSLRHLFVLYPFAYIGIGIVAAKIYNIPYARWGLFIISLILATETLSTFPNEIAFFNWAAGGPRGGFHLLGDSNLDWGQDLPLLAEWQKANPQTTLYLSYFGTADPEHYGIKYIRLPGTELLGPTQLPDRPGVLAISVTNLQGIFDSQRNHIEHLYKPLRQMQPMAMLGGTIYLFNYPLPGGQTIH